ncbi:uncharacterized protein N7483_011608 [Penicillium malachiteum]|uniref:uncharacterized protein n=1 Tax=Penicillium malachiteum TaxID=1324776 RepID=UPI0025491A54|nr:uncharacterized protein N7483_011608 [Penicillium malachiteum]KAJ5714427.1 hypothetical protein N7483_011608 [Penicillium malachiteum]
MTQKNESTGSPVQSDNASLSESSPLPPINRFITTHDKSGVAVFDTNFPEEASRHYVNGGLFTLAYCTNQFPAVLSDDQDLEVYQRFLQEPPGLVVSSGSVCRIVDIGPGFSCPMHRTVSLDYGVVLEGEIELILDSGETRLMKRGDVSIQRGTSHAWKNVTTTVDEFGVRKECWARMLYVLLPVEGITGVGGEKLGEMVSGMGVRQSD